MSSIACPLLFSPEKNENKLFDHVLTKSQKIRSNQAKHIFMEVQIDRPFSFATEVINLLLSERRKRFTRVFLPDLPRCNHWFGSLAWELQSALGRENGGISSLSHGRGLPRANKQTNKKKKKIKKKKQTAHKERKKNTQKKEKCLAPDEKEKKEKTKTERKEVFTGRKRKKEIKRNDYCPSFFKGPNLRNREKKGGLFVLDSPFWAVLFPGVPGEEFKGTGNVTSFLVSFFALASGPQKRFQEGKNPT